MIITKSTLFTQVEIDQLTEVYEVYIKTVIDVKKKICSARCALHADSEKYSCSKGQTKPIFGAAALNSK
jgi:hypothetical protein